MAIQTRHRFLTAEFLDRFLAVHQAQVWSPPGEPARIHRRCIIRQEANESYIRLKQAAGLGDLSTAREHYRRLRGDPQFAQSAKKQLQKACWRRALDDARTADDGVIRPCGRCRTPTAFSSEGGACSWCGARWKWELVRVEEQAPTPQTAGA